MSHFFLKTTFVLACFPANNPAGGWYPNYSRPKRSLKLWALCCFRTVTALDWRCCYLLLSILLYPYPPPIKQSVCGHSQSNLGTWDAWALQRIGKCHSNLSHAVAFQQRVACNLLPALQGWKRESSRAWNHQSGGRRARWGEVGPLWITFLSCLQL